MPENTPIYGMHFIENPVWVYVPDGYFRMDTRFLENTEGYLWSEHYEVVENEDGGWNLVQVERHAWGSYSSWDLFDDRAVTTVETVFGTSEDFREMCQLGLASAHAEERSLREALT